MTHGVFRFQFDSSVALLEAEMTLQLSLFAVEGLFGHARVRLEVGYHADEPRNVIIVDGTTLVGAVLVAVFTSLALHEFGDDALHVRRVGTGVGAANAKGRAA